MFDVITSKRTLNKMRGLERLYEYMSSPEKQNELKKYIEEKRPS